MGLQYRHTNLLNSFNFFSENESFGMIDKVGSSIEDGNKQNQAKSSHKILSGRHDKKYLFNAIKA